jgi:hypothetical protein
MNLVLQYASLGESPPLSRVHSRYSRPSRRGNEGKEEDYDEREDETGIIGGSNVTTTASRHVIASEPCKVSKNFPLTIRLSTY